MISCLIPARCGSKSINFKNIININNKPLIWYTLNAANNSIIDIIYVSTDCDKIKNVVNSFEFKKVIVINRGVNTATDNATTESVMIEFDSKYEYDHLILIQPTSPLLNTKSINNAINKYFKNKYDSLLTLVREYNYQWKINNNDSCSPKYNLNNRLRRQDSKGYLIENGALYITKRSYFRKNKIRVSGNIGYFELPNYMKYEVDEEDDIVIIESLLKKYEEK